MTFCDETAERIIAYLKLQPHPEGGWYRETWRGPEDAAGRAQATAIHFLLEAHQNSHWHRVRDASEVWLWHAGSPLVLAQAETGAGPVREDVLGNDVLKGECPQLIVAAGHWQSAHPLPETNPGWTLVSCIVTPGFDFSVFELTAPDWAPGR